MASSLGSYYITIKPSFEGGVKSIQKQLDGSGMGRQLGQSIGSGAQKSLSSSMGAALERIGSQWQSAGKAMQDVGSKLANRITKPAVAAATAVGGLVTALGFKRLVGIDTARAQFKGLGLDADAVMKQVDAGVTNTSLSMAEGASMAVGILATGAVPLGELEASIKRVANVSAAYGVDANQAAYLLNNVLTKQKVTWGDLSQMQMNNIPVVTALAEHYGVAGDEIMKMAQNGEISIEDLNHVLDTKAGAAAESYAESWEGVTKNILSNLGKIGAKMLEPSFEIIKEKAADFLDLLRSDEWNAWAERAGEAIAGFVDKAISKITELTDYWRGLDEGTQKTILTIGGVAVAAGPVLVVFGKIASAVGGAMTAIGGLMGGKALGGLGGLLGRLAGPIGIAIGLFIGMWQNSDKFRESFTKLWDAVKPVFESLSETLGELFSTVSESLAPVFETLGDVVGGLIESLAPLIAGFLGLLEPILKLLDPLFQIIGMILPPLISLLGFLLEPILFVAEVLMGILGPTIEWLVGVLTGWYDMIADIIGIFIDLVTGQIDLEEAVTQVWQALSDFLSGVWTSLEETASQIWDNMKAAIMGVFEDIANWLGGKWVEIKDDVGAKIDQMKVDLAQKWEDIKAAVVEKWNDIVAWFKGIPQKLKDAIARVKELKDDMKGYIQGVKDGAVEKWNDIVSWFKDLPTKIKNAVGDLGSTLKQAGRDVINGFWEGLKSVWESVKGWFSDITSSIPKLKGPPERDIKLLSDAGDLTMQGYLDGLRKRFPDVERALGGLTDMIPGFAGVPAVTTATGSGADSSVDVLSRLADVLEGLPEDIRAGLLALFDDQSRRSQREGRA